MRAFAYVRVSTREQDEEIQIKAIEEFCRQRGMTIIQYYVDKGESGARVFRDRPAASKLLGDIGVYRPDAVVAWSLDRLGRTMLDTLNTVTELESRGVKVITVKEEWMHALDDNVRRLVLSVLAWVAEFERRRIRERQLEAWAHGKQKGRPRKVKPEVVRKYVEKYRGLHLTDILKIMKSDGYSIGYSTLRRYLKEMRGKKLDLKTTL